MNTKDDYPRRFSWPMRVVLSLLVFDMVVASLLALTPYRDWAEELAMETRPMQPPTIEERAKIVAGQDPNHATVVRRWLAVGKSFARFFVPVPTAETRQKLQQPLDRGKYAVAWFMTRMRMATDLIGFDQDWPMFSPNVPKGDTVGRCRLVFADGTTAVVRNLGDPEDLTWFTHLNEEKLLQVELKIYSDWEGRMGFCNYLSHRHSANAAGSPLARIEVYKVRYEYPPPGADAYEWLRQQTGPPPEQVRPVFWEYDVATKTGRSVK